MPWRGAKVYRSRDGGMTYAYEYAHTSPVTMGRAVTALPDWAGGNVWDDVSTVDVRLSSGTLSSASDLGVLNGMNLAALQADDDWEIVQWVDAELVGANTWRLSRLLRGRFGTERAQGAHAVNDRFVLLSNALRRSPMPSAELGTERAFKAAAAGQAISEAVATTFALAGNSIRPLSPVHVVGARDAGDLTITWVRRARINAAWQNGIDVPLDEPSEAYEIDILDGDDVVRTLTSSTTEVEYTAAQQTTDFGSPQASVAVAIYQMSSRIGRGHAGTGVV